MIKKWIIGMIENWVRDLIKKEIEYAHEMLPTTLHKHLYEKVTDLERNQNILNNDVKFLWKDTSNMNIEFPLLKK